MNSVFPAEKYALAESLLDHRRQEIVPTTNSTMQWLSSSEYWYLVEGSEGRHYRCESVDTEDPTVIVDLEGLLALLREVCSEELSLDTLILRDVEMNSTRLSFSLHQKRWTFCTETARLSASDALDFSATPIARNGTGSHAAFVRHFNLFVVDLEQNSITQLSSDGSKACPTGVEPDSAGEAVALRQMGMTHARPRVSWAPAGDRLLTFHIDQREVKIRPLVDVEAAGESESGLRELHYAHPSEPLPQARWVIYSTDGTAINVADSFEIPYLSPIATGHVWWDPSGEAIYWLKFSRDRKSVRLVEIDPTTGQTATLLTEQSSRRVDVGPYFFDAPVVNVDRERERIYWFSQREGFDALYAYDLKTGTCLDRVTPKDWLTRKILHISDGGLLLEISRSSAENPYVRSVAFVDHHGEGRIVTDDPYDHEATPSPDGKWLLDKFSSLDTPPQWVLRRLDGTIVKTIHSSGVQQLERLGWTPPELVRFPSADGSCDVYGILHRPFNFDEHSKYPLIDHLYPGPQVGRMTGSFYGAFRDEEVLALTALGCAVLTLDGRGTPGRGRDFIAFSDDNLHAAGGLADHAVAIQHLTAIHPWIDADRTTAVGHSGGGFAAVKALLQHPDVFKAGVALAGNHDNRRYNAAWGEAFDSAGITGPKWSHNLQEDIELKAPLLLIHGGLDDNVFPDHTLRLCNRLIANDQDFEMFLIPEAEHLFLGFENFVLRKVWDFLVQHLFRMIPPDFRLQKFPIHRPFTERLIGNMPGYFGC